MLALAGAAEGGALRTLRALSLSHHRVGARGVVTRDIPDWTVFAGNPAQEIGKREVAAR